jgi:hypothetical protein
MTTAGSLFIANGAFDTGLDEGGDQFLGKFRKLHSPYAPFWKTHLRGGLGELIQKNDRTPGIGLVEQTVFNLSRYLYPPQFHRQII